VREDANIEPNASLVRLEFVEIILLPVKQILNKKNRLYDLKLKRIRTILHPSILKVDINMRAAPKIDPMSSPALADVV
jgi:hypothetical protein